MTLIATKTHSDHRTWRNLVSIGVEASSLLTGFHTLEEAMQAADGEKQSTVLPHCEFWPGMGAIVA